jgi:hypothetical protein
MLNKPLPVLYTSIPPPLCVPSQFWAVPQQDVIVRDEPLPLEENVVLLSVSPLAIAMLQLAPQLKPLVDV